MNREEIKELIQLELSVKLAELGVNEISVIEKIPEDSGDSQWICAKSLGVVGEFVVYALHTIHKTVKVIAVPLTYLSVLTFGGNLFVPDSVPSTKELAVAINLALSGGDAPEFKSQSGIPKTSNLYAYHESSKDVVMNRLKTSEMMILSPRRIGKTTTELRMRQFITKMV